MARGRKDISKDAVPFKKGDDPRRNKKGAFSPLSKVLKELSDASEIGYEIEITNKDGTTKTIKNRITSKDGTTVMQLAAIQLLGKAATGDLRAIEMLRDSTEGKPKQPITGGDENDNPIVIFKIPSNER